MRITKTKPITMSNEERIKQNMIDNSFDPPGRLIINGEFHRYHKRGDKSGSKNMWYVFQGIGDFVSGAYGDFKRGIRYKYSSKNPKTMTSKEKADYTTKMEAMLQQKDEEQKRVHSKCRKLANAMLASATQKGTSKHQYTIDKRIKPFSAKLDDSGNLLIPIYSISNKLHGLQFISPEGSKRFLSGTAKSGNFCLLGECPKEAEAIIICEGWATGCTLHQSTKMPVVVACDAGNLKPVAEVWRAELPEVKIVIAGDDDRETKGNPGKTKAINAAQSVRGIAVFPEFENAKGKTDFNDMFQEQGLEAVRDIIMEACAKDPEDDEYQSWSEPIYFGSIDPPEIPCNLLPDLLARICQAVTAYAQTPSGLAVMMALSVVATCLQKLFEVSPYGDSYKEPVNIMTVSAIESGARKTAVVTTLTAPLHEWEVQQEEILREKVAKVRHKREMILKSIDSIKSRASKPETTNEERKEAMKEIKRLEESMPKEIILPMLWTDNVTVERLEQLLVEQRERMSVMSDEGGFFEVVSGLYTGGKMNINAILQGHAGSPVRVQRQGRTVMLHKPALTLGLTVQPDIVSSLASGNKIRFRNNGMLARILFCIPISTVGSRDVTKRESIPKSIKAEFHALIHRLLSIPPQTDDQGKETPKILRLAPEALERWVKFCQHIEDKQGPYGEYYAIRDWTCKLPGAVLRIAGLCHIVEYGTEISTINKTTIRRAIALAKLLIVHAKVAFGSMGGDQAVGDAKFVLKWIMDHPGESFKRSDLQKATHGRFQRVSRLISALKVLTERHIISEPVELPTGRRPKVVYVVNPAILKRDCRR